MSRPIPRGWGRWVAIALHVTKLTKLTNSRDESMNFVNHVQHKNQ